MSESQGGAGRREVAYRLFASEFDDADFSYSESDEERAPNYVVTPTGARVNRLFVVGVLTEIETVSEDYLRARVVDPTGPFVVYAGQYQPDALAFLERADPPAFVAVTGKARTYQPDDSDQVFTSVRPETISEVDASTRDRWVVQAAEQTIERVARMAEAKHSGLAGDHLRDTLVANDIEAGLASGITVALDHYGTTGEYLSVMGDVARDAARVVAGDIDEVETRTGAPDAGGDDAIPALVEEPIDVDAIEEPAPEEEDGSTTMDTGGDEESDSVVAEAGAGNGSAIGTAAASETDTSDGDESGESDDVASAADAVAASDSQAEPAVESTSDSGTEPPVEQTTDEPQESTSTGERDDGAGTMAGAGDTDSDDGVEETAPDSDDDDLEDFEPEFELDEDEREEIEEEFGTEFQSGSEVDKAGAADIDTPDSKSIDESEDAAEPASAEGEETVDDSSEPVETETTPTTSDEESSESTDVVETGSPDDGDLEDVDLEDAVMEAMQDLDEGDGAERDDVLAAVVDRASADPGEVEDAIQDALMGGRCYEPDDETLKPI